MKSASHDKVIMLALAFHTCMFNLAVRGFIHRNRNYLPMGLSSPVRGVVLVAVIHSVYELLHMHIGALEISAS